MRFRSGSAYLVGTRMLGTATSPSGDGVGGKFLAVKCDRRASADAYDASYILWHFQHSGIFSDRMDSRGSAAAVFLRDSFHSPRALLAQESSVCPAFFGSAHAEPR